MREGRGEIEGREQGLKERRRECVVLRDALSEVDVERARTGSDLDHLARECQQSVGVAAAEAAATPLRRGPGPGPRAPSPRSCRSCATGWSAWAR